MSRIARPHDVNSAQFEHERLEAYPLALRLVEWAISLKPQLWGPARGAHERLVGICQSLPMRIACGGGRRILEERLRDFDAARAAAMECVAIIDVLSMRKAMPDEDASAGKRLLEHLDASLQALMDREEDTVEQLQAIQVDGSFTHRREDKHPAAVAAATGGGRQIRGLT